jgi:hypothetical protein
MPLHLIKMCVGVTSIADLEGWIDETRSLMTRLKRPYEQIHTTRNFPKRAAEILSEKPLENGSLYWVIKGKLVARQRILDIRPVVDNAGVSRCNLLLQHHVVPVDPRPYRPFQGWRYLEGTYAPRDISDLGKGATELPEDMRNELAKLGLL